MSVDGALAAAYEVAQKRMPHIDAEAVTRDVDSLLAAIQDAQAVDDWVLAYRLATWVDARHGQPGAINSLGAAWPGASS